MAGFSDDPRNKKDPEPVLLSKQLANFGNTETYDLKRIARYVTSDRYKEDNTLKAKIARLNEQKQKIRNWFGKPELEPTHIDFLRYMIQDAVLPTLFREWDLAISGDEAPDQYTEVAIDALRELVKRINDVDKKISKKEDISIKYQANLLFSINEISGKINNIAPLLDVAIRELKTEFKQFSELTDEAFARECIEQRFILGGKGRSVRDYPRKRDVSAEGSHLRDISKRGDNIRFAHGRADGLLSEVNIRELGKKESTALINISRRDYLSNLGDSIERIEATAAIFRMVSDDLQTTIDPQRGQAR
ncbi:MAG: hypothetical protein LW823_00630 [Rickettsiales bacterium]|jgi:hypothetical protein|nr:hypothetical protein [Rickettsiales bacterium]